MIIDALLDEAAQVGLATTLEDHWSRVEAFDTRFTDTVDRAAFGGFSSDRLGFAFVAGYRAALQRLVPSLGGRRACLCATEEGGAHPRAIKATLADGRLRGTKTFATLASHAEELLVVVSVGEREGRNELRVARIPRSRAGVVVEEKAPWPVAPEIPHAIVRFEDVAVAEGDLLEGDGYARYLKPFRTIEDIHVMASTAGYLFSVGRIAGWERAALEALAASIASLRAIAAFDPSQRGTHLALAGTIAAVERAVATLDFSKAPSETRERWERDAPLLQVAGKARAARRDAAWRSLDGE